MIIRLDGERVRELREELWMSRSKFADASGVGQSTLFNVETNATGVRPDTAHKIARVLGLDARSLALSCSSKQPVEMLREGAVA